MQWITRDMGQPMVQWGLRPGNYNDTEIGNFSTYTRADMCGAPANTTGYFFPGIMNNALMVGLPPSTRIYYRVGDPVRTPSPLPATSKKFLSLLRCLPSCHQSLWSPDLVTWATWFGHLGL